MQIDIDRGIHLVKLQIFLHTMSIFLSPTSQVNQPPFRDSSPPPPFLLKNTSKLLYSILKKIVSIRHIHLYITFSCKIDSNIRVSILTPNLFFYLRYYSQDYLLTDSVQCTYKDDDVFYCSFFQVIPLNNLSS